MWMGVLFRDGTGKRCKGNVVIFTSDICRAWCNLPYLGYSNDEKNVF